MIGITIDGQRVEVRAGISVAAAIMNAGGVRFRDSVTGTPRAPLCGMGTCFECRVIVDGESHVRACMIVVRDGMTVLTAAGGKAGEVTG